jgi:hypothetical protein
MTELPPEEHLVSFSRLRRAFNERGIWLQAQRGELDERLISEGHPSPPLSDDPVCTRSQIVAYVDDTGVEIVRVHQYMRPDGRLGGTSGAPDPQEMLGPDGRWWIGGYYPAAEE